MAFHLGETIRLKASDVKDLDDAAITTPTVSIDIYNPDGTLRETLTTFTESSAGNFYRDYTIPSGGSAGIW